MNRLKVARAEIRRTQFLLSLETRIPQSRISFIENGLIEPRQDEKERLAKALGLGPDEIFPEVQK